MSKNKNQKILVTFLFAITIAAAAGLTVLYAQNSYTGDLQGRFGIVQRKTIPTNQTNHSPQSSRFDQIVTKKVLTNDFCTSPMVALEPADNLTFGMGSIGYLSITAGSCDINLKTVTLEFDSEGIQEDIDRAAFLDTNGGIYHAYGQNDQSFADGWDPHLFSLLPDVLIESGEEKRFEIQYEIMPSGSTDDDSINFRVIDILYVDENSHASHSAMNLPTQFEELEI